MFTLEIGNKVLREISVLVDMYSNALYEGKEVLSNLPSQFYSNRPVSGSIAFEVSGKTVEVELNNWGPTRLAPGYKGENAVFKKGGRLKKMIHNSYRTGRELAGRSHKVEPLFALAYLILSAFSGRPPTPNSENWESAIKLRLAVDIMEKFGITFTGGGSGDFEITLSHQEVQAVAKFWGQRLDRLQWSDELPDPEDPDYDLIMPDYEI